MPLLNEHGEPLTRPGWCAVDGCQERAAAGEVTCEMHTQEEAA